MSKFFLRDTSPTQANYASALPDLIYLPLNIGRFIPRQPDSQLPFISPPSNSVNLTDWINHGIETETIILPAGGNGIYGGSDTIPTDTQASFSEDGNFGFFYSFGDPALYFDEAAGEITLSNILGDTTIFLTTDIITLSTFHFTLNLREGLGAIFTDTRPTPRGIEYALDYSATFSNLSLVTKQYVDSVAGGNGIYGGSNTVPTNTVASIAGNFNFTTPSTTGGTTSLGWSTSGLKFTDSRSTPIGITYNANYSATFTPRSLVDKFYVDTLIDGRKWKQEVRVATTANITLSGEQTIDGILTSASRVLVKNQSTTANNGIYLSAAGAWTRTTDADLAPELDAAAVSVAAGTVNANRQYYQTESPVIIGTNPNLWVPISSGAYTADGQGIELTGNEFSIELDGTSITKSSLGLKVNYPTGWTGAAKKVGSFTVVSAGAFTQTISVSPYADSDVVVHFRDTNDEEIVLAVDTTLSGSNISVSGFAPSSSYIIKYILIA